MKANELMIGDWVQVPCLTDNVEHYDAWYKVKQLRDCDLDVIGFKELKYNEIMPIPLTAKILEKNGFGYKEEDGYMSHYYLGHRGYLANPDLHIGTYNKGVYWLNYYDNAIHGIKYVHKLQHALRLCGIN
ncbi:MAG: hypothetical protein IJU02_07505, partial [Lachnospiraceae bacterium]|nr:hypothetical protein [Lachnospiraceae bacterium]